MTTKEEMEFLDNLRQTMKEHPDWLGSAMNAIQSGIKGRINQEVDNAKEWETVAINAIEGRLFNSNKNWIRQKIEAMETRAFFRWSHIIERMKK